MSLESSLDSLTTAVNALVAQLQGNPAPATPPPAPPADPASAAVVTPKKPRAVKETPATPPADNPTPAPAYPEVQEVRNAAQAFVDLCIEKGQDVKTNDASQLIAVLNTKYATGGKLSAVREDARAEVIAALKAATEVTRAKPAVAESGV